MIVLSRADTGVETVRSRRAGLTDLPEPDCLEYAWNQGCVCAIRHDGGTLAASLARQLIARGWRVVVLEGSPTPWEDTFSAIADQSGRLTAWIDIHHRIDESPADLLSSENEEARLRSTFLMAKHLKPLLNAADCGRAWFMVVTHIDGKLGLDTPPKTQGIVSAGLLALPKTLRHEWPSVFCRAVDLHPELDVETAASCLVGELYDPDRMLSEVGHGPDGRCTIAAFEAGRA